MANKLRFILDNDADTASTTLSVGTEATDYPLSNLKTIPRSSKFRSVENTTITICGTWTTPQDISALVIGRHNFTEYITWQLTLYDTANCESPGTLLYDSGINQISAADIATDLLEWGEFPWGTRPWGLNSAESKSSLNKDTVFWIPESVAPIANVRLFKLTLTEGLTTGTLEIYCNDTTIMCNYYFILCNSGNLGTILCNDTGILCNNVLILVTENAAPLVGNILPYFEVGRLFLGKYVEPLYNISYGHKLSWNENTSQYRPGSGALRSDKVTANKKIEFNLGTIPESDRITLHKTISEKGLSDDLFIAVFPEDAAEEKKIDYRGIVKFTKVPKYREYLCNYYGASFTVEEV